MNMWRNTQKKMSEFRFPYWVRNIFEEVINGVGILLFICLIFGVVLGGVAVFSSCTSDWYMNHYPAKGEIVGKEVVVSIPSRHLIFYRDASGKGGQVAILEKDYARAEVGDSLTVKFHWWGVQYQVWDKDGKIKGE
jgi:hypothetical protein